MRIERTEKILGNGFMEEVKQMLNLERCQDLVIPKKIEVYCSGRNSMLRSGGQICLINVTYSEKRLKKDYAWEQ